MFTLCRLPRAARNRQRSQSLAREETERQLGRQGLCAQFAAAARVTLPERCGEVAWPACRRRWYEGRSGRADARHQSRSECFASEATRAPNICHVRLFHLDRCGVHARGALVCGAQPGCTLDSTTAWEAFARARRARRGRRAVCVRRRLRAGARAREDARRAAEALLSPRARAQPRRPHSPVSIDLLAHCFTSAMYPCNRPGLHYSIR